MSYSFGSSKSKTVIKLEPAFEVPIFPISTYVSCEMVMSFFPVVIDCLIWSSVCFGSLLTAVIKALHQMAQEMRRSDNNAFACIAECLLSMLDG